MMALLLFLSLFAPCHHCRRLVISGIHCEPWILSGNARNDFRFFLRALFIAMQRAKWLIKFVCITADEIFSPFSTIALRMMTQSVLDQTRSDFPFLIGRELKLNQFNVIQFVLANNFCRDSKPINEYLTTMTCWHVFHCWKITHD